MIEDAYPLTALQAGMLYHSALDTGTYHDISTMTLRSAFDAEALAAALAEVARRHPVLRTSFDLTEFSEPLQLVHDAAEIPLQVVPGADEDAVRRWHEEEKRESFDWAAPPLLRVCAHLLPGERFALSVSFHHAILDGWSVAALMTEILRRYTAHLADAPLPVEPPGAHFRDLVVRERELVASPDAQRFWEEVIAEAPEGTLPRLPGYPADGGTSVEVVAATLPPAVATGLEKAAQSLMVPLRTVLLAAHLRVVGLLTGESDALTGMVVHGRPESEAAGEVLGLFLNTVPVRLRVDAPSWSDLIRRVFDAEVALLPYRQYPFMEIQRASGRARLLDALFDFRDFHVYRAMPVEVEDQDFFEQTDLPLTAAFASGPTGLHLTLSFDRTQFSREQVEEFQGHYLTALRLLADDPRSDPRPAAPYLAARDNALIEQWNATSRPYPANSLHGLVWEQADATPDAIAVEYEGERLDYRELASRASGLAVLLGTATDRVVGVCLERSLELPVALLGVLASGGAYLPLEPGHPPARLARMLADAGADTVVTTRALADGLPEGVRAVLVEDAGGGSVDADAAAGAGRVATPPGALAYVIFTSGSTGRPKGVAVSHQAITNRLHWMRETYGADQGGRILHKTPYTFDVSVWELFLPLITGGRLVIARPGGQLEPGYLADLIAERRVTMLHFVPSMLAAFLEAPEAGRLGSVRQVICSGEALGAEVVARFGALLPKVELHNLYGPTEAAVDVSAHHCAPGEAVVPIGHPVANTTLEVLDEQLQRVPVGVTGELCIGGVQLARGYLGRAALTAERFVPDPYGPPGARLYRTGDLARRGPDGELEFLGRTDQQVKIRGMRVEPGEIETALLAQPEVRAAVVTAPEGRLVGYLVSDDSAGAVDWRDRLRTELPDHMIPRTWVRLDALPLTANGKLDRSALPPPGAPSGRRYVPPRDQVEAALAVIWEELLDLPSVGVLDDFFELGGHSLLALRLSMRIRKDLGRDLPVATVLTAPTVARLADVLRSPGDLGGGERVVALNPDGERPPIFMVHGLGGQVFRYQPLARRLGPDQPVYAIAAQGLADDEDPHTTLAEMVGDYIDAIRAVRPHGPYVLGGFCIGGNIALEAARLLRALGEEVPLVALLYSDAREPVIASSLDDDVALMFHAIAGGPLDIDFEKFARLGPDERLLAVVGAAAEADRLSPDTADLDQARRYLRVFRANAHAVGRLRHEPYDGDVALFAPGGDDLGWSEVVRGRFTTAPIPEERVPILYEPLVAETAATMRNWMDDGIPNS